MNDTVEWRCAHTVGVPAAAAAGNGFMNHWRMMRRVAALNQAVYGDLAARGTRAIAAFVNLGLLGLFYGLTSAGLSGRILARLEAGDAVSYSPLALTLAGVLVVYLLHAGAALFLWVFCRGIGGHPRLAAYYQNLGVAGIVLWPVAPVVACLQAQIGGAPLMIGAAVAGAWGAAAAVAAVQAASGLSNVKMALAVAATVTYAGCFLYLWI